MPIYDPSSPEEDLARAAHPQQPVSTLPYPKQAPHHPDLSVQASPPSTRRDSSHRHLKANEDEWADSDPILTDEITPSLPPDTNSTTATNRQLGPSSESQRSPTTRPPQQGVTIGPGTLFSMGPCTCTDASAHNDSCPSPATRRRPSYPTRTSDHEYEEGYDTKREKRIESARREILFGDEKVSEEVAREAMKRLRESEEGMWAETYRNGGEGGRND